MTHLGPYPLDSIITGDARELAKAIPDESVDLVLTDPPFGIGFNYGNGIPDDPAEYLDLVRWIITEGTRIIKPGGLCFVFVSQSRLRQVWPMFPDDSRIFAACKNFVRMTASIAVQPAYDPVIYWQKGKRAWTGRDWCIGNTANTNGRGMDEVDFHNCPKPLNTISYMVEHWSEPGDVVVDWFMGSATTAVAAKILHRHWLGFEIDPDTAERARKRILTTQAPLVFPEPEQLTMEV